MRTSCVTESRLAFTEGSCRFVCSTGSFIQRSENKEILECLCLPFPASNSQQNTSDISTVCAKWQNDYITLKNEVKRKRDC